MWKCFLLARCQQIAYGTALIFSAQVEDKLKAALSHSKLSQQVTPTAQNQALCAALAPGHTHQGHPISIAENRASNSSNYTNMPYLHFACNSTVCSVALWLSTDWIHSALGGHCRLVGVDSDF